MQKLIESQYIQSIVYVEEDGTNRKPEALRKMEGGQIKAMPSPAVAKQNITFGDNRDMEYSSTLKARLKMIKNEQYTKD